MKYTSFIIAFAILAVACSLGYVERSVNDRIDSLSDRVDDSFQSQRIPNDYSNLEQKVVKDECLVKGGKYEESNQSGGGMYVVYTEAYGGCTGSCYGSASIGEPTPAPKVPEGGYHDTQCTVGDTVYSLDGLNWVLKSSTKTL